MRPQLLSAEALARASASGSSWAGCVYEVAINATDLCLGDFWVTPLRRATLTGWGHGTFSVPFASASFHLLTQHQPAPQQSFWSDLRTPLYPFTGRLWALVSTVILVHALAYFLAESSAAQTRRRIAAKTRKNDFDREAHSRSSRRRTSGRSTETDESGLSPAMQLRLRLERCAKRRSPLRRSPFRSTRVTARRTGTADETGLSPAMQLRLRLEQCAKRRSPFRSTRVTARCTDTVICEEPRLDAQIVEPDQPTPHRWRRLANIYALATPRRSGRLALRAPTAQRSLTPRVGFPEVPKHAEGSEGSAWVRKRLNSILYPERTEHQPPPAPPAIETRNASFSSATVQPPRIPREWFTGSRHSSVVDLLLRPARLLRRPFLSRAAHRNSRSHPTPRKPPPRSSTRSGRLFPSSAPLRPSHREARRRE